jgi:putative ABC transport system permease protein
VFGLLKNRMRPALYASFLQILRSRKSQTFMMAFLMLTIAIGILNADTASTVNASQETQLKYDLGADVVIKEAWMQKTGAYVETDAARYGQIPGVTSIAKVFRDDGSSATAGKTQLTSVSLMGVDTKAFGETAYMPDGLLDEHFFTYLNAMSQNPGDCLVSANFRDILGLEVGDAISVRCSDQPAVTSTIAGFVPYFPTYNQAVYATREDGTKALSDKYLIVCNLNYLQSAWGVLPYEIWLKSPGSADSVYDYANASGQRYWAFQDVYTKLSALRNSPSIQGTNGILTLSFIVGLALCAAGFLIFWILSIRSRSLQFGIYRAMGMSVSEIVGMLLNEQFWQSVLSIASGAGIGYLVSRLYIPLIQIAYSSADASLPLVVTRDLWDHARLFAINGVVLAACVTILILIIRRLKMAQALKLGED